MQHIEMRVELKSRFAVSVEVKISPGVASSLGMPLLNVRIVSQIIENLELTLDHVGRWRIEIRKQHHSPRIILMSSKYKSRLNNGWTTVQPRCMARRSSLASSRNATISG